MTCKSQLSGEEWRALYKAEAEAWRAIVDARHKPSRPIPRLKDLVSRWMETIQAIDDARAIEEAEAQSKRYLIDIWEMHRK